MPLNTSQRILVPPAESTNKIFVLLIISLGLASLVLIAVATNATDAAGGAALMIGAITLAAILYYSLSSAGDGLELNVANVAGLYGFVYGIYYLGPLVFFAFRQDVPQNNVVEMSFLILGGFVAFRVGTMAAGSQASASMPRWTTAQRRSLLILCWIGFLSVLAGYAVAASLGLFFKHQERQVTKTADLMQGSTLDMPGQISVLFQFCLPFQFPILMISMLLSATGSRAAKISFRFFMIALLGIMLLSSQFRMMMTLIIVAEAVRAFATRRTRFSWGNVLLLGVLGTVTIVLIYGARIAKQQHPGKSVGPLEAGGLVIDGLQIMTEGSGGLVGSAATRRVSSDLILLSDLIDVTRNGTPYIYGSVMVTSLEAMVPHLFWKDKPMMIPVQRQIRHAFGLPDSDDSAGPLIADFAAGGPIGVLVGLFVFGFLCLRLANWASKGDGAFRWMLFIWILSSVLFVEADQTLGILSSIRHCILAWCIYRAVLFFQKPSRGCKTSADA